MRLYLVRHGEAKSEWEDALRPLTDNGRKNVRKIAESAKGKGLTFTKIFHSGKTRAEQTAKIISEIFQFMGPVEMTDGLKPNDDVLAWVERLSHYTEDIMLVGHLPFLDYFASILVTGSMNTKLVGFNPGSLACLEMDEETGQWELLYVFHAETNL